jgi:pilus assembly protein CpaC
MKLFVRSTLVALSLFSVPAFANPSPQSAPAAAAQETITLRVGEAKELLVKGLTRVALGNPEHADVDVSEGGTLRIQGLKAGETTLLVWRGKERKAYHIVVQG